MFGTKKDKILEAELQEVKQQLQQKEQTMDVIAQKQDDVVEHFTRMTASRAQMDTELTEVVSHVKVVKETSEQNCTQAKKLSDDLNEALTILQKANKEQELFVEKMSKQRDEIQEIVEQNKHFTTPAKYLTDYVVSNRKEQETIRQNTEKMLEAAKNMSVLSLNAAIEAGRMGDSGRKFVDAAEEIRSFSSQYEETATTIVAQLKESEKKNQELEEQVKHLNTLLRDNNVAMGRVLKDSMVEVDHYKREGGHLKAAYLQDALDAAAAFAEKETETIDRQESILLQMEGIGEEFMEQRECCEELENICKEVMNSVTIEDVGKNKES